MLIMASIVTRDAGAVVVSPTPRPNVIEVRDLTRRFGAFTAVDGISFDVREGEVFAFLGPNGAGKSTTINVLCTLAQPTAGHARSPGSTWPPGPRRCGDRSGWSSRSRPSTSS